MARVKSTGTTPEMIVRRAFHAAGLRFRLHRRDLPGTPDLVLPRFRAAVFVHGCFWHCHPGCPRARTPSTRRDYWIPKLARNVARDAAAQSALRAAGWQCHVIWECETRQAEALDGFIAAVQSCGESSDKLLAK